MRTTSQDEINDIIKGQKQAVRNRNEWLRRAYAALREGKPKLARNLLRQAEYERV